ncbi:hypothetical protein CMK12_17430 [Candidatus Poribacteria bacterium]|nr:hypothetical protein [Candidatus Poribacteria bacterium]
MCTQPHPHLYPPLQPVPCLYPACTYDEKELVLYEDGQETGRTKVTGAIGPRSSEFRIARPFAGAIDEVKLYNRALSSAEIESVVAAVSTKDKLASASGKIKSE